MKLLGREITAEKVVARIEARLRERGLMESPAEPIQFGGVEPRVDPLSFNLRAMEENLDPTVGLPLQTHRTGIGQSVIWVKQGFRVVGKVVINDLLGRQRVFNGLVLDSYAQLSAEVLRLREEVAKLQAERRGAGGDRHDALTARATTARPGDDRSARGSDASEQRVERANATTSGHKPNARKKKSR